MRKLLLAALLFLGSSATPVSAVELRFGASVESEYNSRVLVDTDDFITTFRPSIAISHQDHERNWDANFLYRPGYELHHKESGLSADSHRVEFKADWRPDVRTRLYVEELYREVPNAFRLVELTDIGDDISFGTGETTSNSFTLGAERTLAPRWTSTASFSHFVFDRDSGQDTTSITTSVSVSYRWNEDHQSGVAFRFRNTETEFRGETTSDLDTFELLGTWAWNIDSRTTLRVQLGPAMTRSDVPGINPAQRLNVRQIPFVPGTQDIPAIGTCDTVQVGTSVFPFLSEACGGVPDLELVSDPGVNVGFEDGTDFGQPGNSDVNIFGNVSLERRFRRGFVRFTWTRTDSQTQQIGGGGTSIDTLSGQAAYNLSQRTTFTFTGSFLRRESFGEALRTVVLLEPTTVGVILSLNPFTVGDAQVLGTRSISTLRDSSTNRVETWSLSFRAEHDYTRRIVFFGEASYREQTSEGSFATGIDNTRYLFGLGIRYNFDPIRL